MRYRVLATDFDGTLAHHGKVNQPTVMALQRLLVTGRELVLVTGRTLDELLAIFPECYLFALIVAENGAVVYCPASRKSALLCSAPPPELVSRLKLAGLPLGIGQAIVATWRPHETTLLEAIRELGLDMQIIFNKDAVMALPSGVNKATGLVAALAEMDLSPHEAVGVGDAENDHALLNLCECGVAVANALPALKDRAEMVTAGDHGDGVTELIDALIANDLADIEGRLTRHHLLLGTRADGAEVRLPPFGKNILAIPSSENGRSPVVQGLLDRLGEHAYQFCLIDPEGRYDGFAGAVTMGTRGQGPSVGDVLHLLSTPGQNAVVNGVGLASADRAAFVRELLRAVQALRGRTGRPHWLGFDRAHLVLPKSGEFPMEFHAGGVPNVLVTTSHPGEIAPAMLSRITTVIAEGGEPANQVTKMGEMFGGGILGLPTGKLEEGNAFFWSSDVQAGLILRLAPLQGEPRQPSNQPAAVRLPCRTGMFSPRPSNPKAP